MRALPFSLSQIRSHGALRTGVLYFGSWLSIGTDWVLRIGSQEARKETGRQCIMAMTESDLVPMDCIQDGRKKRSQE